MDIEQRFSFIKDETLRTNVINTFRYFIYLIELEQKIKLGQTVLHSFYKDMTVQLASVIEACEHYVLKSFIDAGIILSSEVMEEEWVDEKEFKIEETNERQIITFVRHKSPIKLTKHTQFIHINRACKRARIIGTANYEQAEKLREARNKIHLAGLTSIDDTYTKEDVDSFFQASSTILDELEEKLKELER